MVKRPMKIAWVSFYPIERLPQLPEQLRNLPSQHSASWMPVLLEELKRRQDIELHVFAVRKHFERQFSFQQDGVTFHCVKVPGKMRMPSLYWWETLIVRRQLKAIRPDLVHAWGMEGGAALVASRLPYPFLTTVQGLLEWYQESANFGWLARLESRIGSAGLRRSSIATAESRFAGQWLRQRYPHLEVLQAEHAPNWVFHKLQRRPQTSPVQFLYVGSLCHWKGTDLLLQALDRLVGEIDFRLTLVGSPAFDFSNERLKSIGSSALWARITHRRGLTAAQVAEEMSRATCLVFPTRADNSPNAVKEAVVAGLPVVGSNVGGLLDYVIPGLNGTLFPNANLDELVKAIRATVSHPVLGRGEVDPDTLAKMRDYLSPRVMEQRFLAAYQRVLERAGGLVAS